MINLCEQRAKLALLLQSSFFELNQKVDGKGELKRPNSLIFLQASKSYSKYIQFFFQ